MAELSPMMKQYFNIKAQYQNCILFYRLGDFYEMFYDDAKLVSKELELTLTGRDCGQEERAPMCGVPFHSSEAYIARLVAKGYKVAICEQMEDPATAKGLVKRDIVRVVTPGTVLEGSMLDEAKNNYISVLCCQGNKMGLCFADISTGEVYATQLEGEPLGPMVENELGRYMPKEILINPECVKMNSLAEFIKNRLHASVEMMDEDDFEYNRCKAQVLEQFKKENLAALGVTGEELIVSALGALLTYLSKTQRVGLERINSLSLYAESQYMKLDMATRRNLELTETMRSKEKKGSLLGVLDQTRTAMGKRLIRTWLERPLVQCTQIIARLNGVEELADDNFLRASIGEQLTGIHDLERLLTRIVYGSANARDLRSLAEAIRRIPSLKAVLDPARAALLCRLKEQMDSLDDICALIDRAIVEEPPLVVREGGMIRPGYHEELDLLRGDMTDGHGVIAKIEAQEREKTGIKNLKIGYNRVFGYYIEVSNSNKDAVPQEYIRKQTLTNCERFITQELKQLEGRILGAKEKSVQLEYELFQEVRKKTADQLERIQRTAQAVAQLDVLTSFAESAVRYQYCRPTVNMDGRVVLKDSRHPVVEAILDGKPFVPNDVLLDKNENRVAIITGPNMAGKSTYMRQTALIVLMAQCGCFVPATAAEIGIVDSIFTRVGASDDLAAGQSTFMVEMTEVAYILRNATSNSLLVLDEIGRGTSTFDGMSIARAVLEHVADKKKLGAKALFATHYHELTELEECLNGVKNYNIAVKKHGDDITFLRRIVRGGADDSYGIQVAKLAGIPDSVVRRAKRILKDLETSSGKETVRDAVRQPEPESEQICLESSPESALVEQIQKIDVNRLTPMEAMNLLFDLWQKAQMIS